MMRKTAAHMVSAILVLALAAGPVAALAKDETKPAKPRAFGVVKEKRASLRAKANKRSSAITTLTRLSPLEILAKSGSYTKVKTPKGTVGYVYSRYLVPSPYLSVTADKTNVRSGPGTQHPVLFYVMKGYPLRALRKQGRYIQVEDYEGDKGWVHQNLLSTKRWVIVKLDQINLREGPATTYPLRFQAPKGAPFEVLAEKDGWLHVRYVDGDEAWCSANIVWGWQNG